VSLAALCGFVSVLFVWHSIAKYFVWFCDVKYCFGAEYFFTNSRIGTACLVLRLCYFKSYSNVSIF
jgi:hypothetical protein